MKNKIALLLLLVTMPSVAANSFGGFYGKRYEALLFFEGFYGIAPLSPSALNTARENFVWNGTRASSGSFGTFMYGGGSIGWKLFHLPILSLRYETQRQALPTTDVGSGYTVTDSFDFSSLLLLVDIPIPIKPRWSLTLGGGVGYAMKYEFHQYYSGNQEDITFKAHPFIFRGRVTCAYNFTKHIAAFTEVIYDQVTALSLTTDSAYDTLSNGMPITSGQPFYDPNTGNSAAADMSGFRFGLGLRISI